MKPFNNSDRAWALSITLGLALTLVSSILLAFSFTAAESTAVAPMLQAPLQPMVTCGGPIRVEATNSGNDANYATLALAFGAINAGTHTGAINIGVCASVTDGTMATLNASGVGSASYTSVVLTPAGGAARTLNGAIAPGSPLIDLNGADNVTIDGLNTGGNSLTISNTTVSGTDGTSTIRLSNGASNNTISNSTILGSATPNNLNAGGNILISTSTGGANAGNLIQANAVGPAGANLPTNGIMSRGSASPNNNTGNVITLNNVFDFFNPTLSCAGINIQDGSDTTIISNNRIYQTAPRTFTSNNLTYSGILASLATPSGANTGSATITGNIIGFGAANGTGTTTISGLANRINGIQIARSTTTVPTSVQNNTISGFNQTTSAGAANSTSGFIGIAAGTASGSFVNIGGTTGNTIGSLDGSSTIVINNTTGTANSLGFIGISDFSFQDLIVVSNNRIGAITINDGGSGTSAGFRGIRLSSTAGRNVTINNNIIGGTGAGSIVDNVVGINNLYGIDSTGANLTCNGNLIRNISGFANASGVINMTGIIISGTISGASTISGNTIHSLSDNAGNIANGAVYGIHGGFPSTANVVEKNVIHSLKIISANLSSQLAGIVAATGSATYKNNMVRLGVDAAGGSITSGFAIYGMFELAGTNNFYSNSIYLGGAGVGSASNTFAFVSNVTSNTRNYLDNIFENARSNGSGTAKNYAMTVGGTAPNPAGLTSNRNDLYAPGTGGLVGLFNAVDQPTLANWQTATGQDAASLSADPQFLDPNGTARPGFGFDYGRDVLAALVNLHIAGTSPCVAAGIPIPGVSIDIDNELRNPSTPDIGADEVTPFAAATPTPTPVPTPGITTHFSVVAPGSVTGFVPFNFTVTALDQSNGTVTNYPGTIHFTSTDGSATLPPDSMLTNGTGTFSATLRQIFTSRTITATDTSNPSITGTSNNIFIGKSGTPSPTPTPTPTPPPTVCNLPEEGFAQIFTLVSTKGWVMRNNSQPLGSTPGWIQGDTSRFVAQSGPANSYVAVNYQSGSATATLNNWLITPPLTLQNGGQLSFWTRTVDSPKAPDRLQVRLSLNGTSSFVGSTSTSVGDFTTLLLDINPTYLVIGYPTGWTNYFVTLSGVASPVKGRLAFRYFVENGGPDGLNSDYIGIDTVQYACNGGLPTPTPTPPVPTPTPTPVTISISGAVSYCSSPSSGPVPNATLTLTGSGSGSTLSDSSGNYKLSPAFGGSYTVTPTKADRMPGSAGINTVDVIAIQRHFLFLGTPLAGCRLAAADVNSSAAVDTVDVIAVQRFFLIMPTGTANVGKYRFSPVNRSYAGGVGDQTGENYNTLIFGDVATPLAE